LDQLIEEFATKNFEQKLQTQGLAKKIENSEKIIMVHNSLFYHRPSNHMPDR